MTIYRILQVHGIGERYIIKLNAVTKLTLEHTYSLSPDKNQQSQTMSYYLNQIKHLYAYQALKKLKQH